jgi:alpha-L-fucosidase 2
MRHTLQIDTPADGFADCYLLGNGALGAAVHGRPGTERVDLNLDTLWSGGPRRPQGLV